MANTVANAAPATRQTFTGENVKICTNKPPRSARQRWELQSSRNLKLEAMKPDDEGNIEMSFALSLEQLTQTIISDKH